MRVFIRLCNWRSCHAYDSDKNITGAYSLVHNQIQHMHVDITHVKQHRLHSFVSGIINMCGDIVKEITRRNTKQLQ